MTITIACISESRGTAASSAGVWPDCDVGASAMKERMLAKVVFSHGSVSTVSALERL